MRLVAEMPGSAAADEVFIVCPFLAGLHPVVGLWLGPLAWHDCNAALLAGLGRVPEGVTVFAGVFCADPFRAVDDLLAALRAAGVAGVVNLPSVSFFDGEFGRTLGALNLGVEREIEFLRRAAELGFRVAGCVRGVAEARVLGALGAELILAHAGPGARQGAEERLVRRLQGGGALVLGMSELIEGDR